MRITLDLTPEQLAALDLAFDGLEPTEATETALMMVTERFLRDKLADLTALNSPLAQPAIANVESKLSFLYSLGCPCLPE